MNPQDSNHQPYTGYQPPAAVPATPASPHVAPQPHVTQPPFGAFSSEPPVGVPTPGSARTDALAPQPVVKVLSPIGVEYVFLTVTLFVAAVALASALIVLVNGAAGFASLAFPAAALIVAVPVFAAIFLHLKKLELQDPQLKLDPSKRRSTQATQIISFVVCLFTLIGFFSAAFAAMGGGSEAGVTIGKAALDSLCVLVVAGGILFYYWRDEHKTKA